MYQIWNFCLSVEVLLSCIYVDISVALNHNNYLENQNIFISGLTEKNDQVIKWEITKIE